LRIFDAAVHRRAPRPATIRGSGVRAVEGGMIPGIEPPPSDSSPASVEESAAAEQQDDEDDDEQCGCVHFSNSNV